MTLHGRVVRDRGSGACSGPVRVSYFDPRTGEPCETKPEPLRSDKPCGKRHAALEREAERARAVAEAREISERMMARRKGGGSKGGRRGGRRAVLVDGLRYESVKLAAEAAGCRYQYLCTVLSGGGAVVKGHPVAYAEGGPR